jgi:hypothetical protein
MSHAPALSLRLLIAFLSITTLGCAAYRTPGRGANLDVFERKSLTDRGLVQVMQSKPLAVFPAGIAMVRLQSPGYISQTTRGIGQGKYCVIVTRDIEKDEHFKRITELPKVAGVASISRLLLPNRFDSDLELRHVAAKLHADLLLIYTVDTVFYTDDMASPLTVVTLGLIPTRVAHVTSTCSALLIDTRSGYLYATAEATSKKSRLANAWSNKFALDTARLNAETDAFDQMVGQFEVAWHGVVASYASTPNRIPFDTP